MDLRKLDALVAENVMGLKIGAPGWIDPIPFYSNDIAAAEEVWDKLIEGGYLALEINKMPEGDIKLTIFEHYTSDKEKNSFISARGATKSLVICLAALKAKDVNVSAFEK